MAGEHARAIEVLDASIRLDPFAPPYWSFGIMGLANYTLERYGEAVRWLRETTLRLPNWQSSHVWLRSGYGQLGQLEEARKEAAEVLRINPGFTIEGFKHFSATRTPRTSSTVLTGCARLGCRRLEPWRWVRHNAPPLTAALPSTNRRTSRVFRAIWPDARKEHHEGPQGTPKAPHRVQRRLANTTLPRGLYGLS
jgi:tetratricopeptide (TPR) repeat protein